MADESKFKYLAIRNWRKYQPTKDRKGKTMDGRSAPWIKDYTDKEMDPAYMDLSMNQRYVFDGLRRLRGKYGKNDFRSRYARLLMWRILAGSSTHGPALRAFVRAANQKPTYFCLVTRRKVIRTQ
jgi:hypothetical protein